MKANFLSPKTITSLEELEELLLARIPEKHRENFLSPVPPHELNEIHHGISLVNLKKAKKLIETAREKHQQVLIFGDYDCDGITSTAILFETLEHLGLSVKTFLPDRERHGYGMSVKALEEIWQNEQPNLVITVDNGIVAHDAFAWLKNKGVKTILTDHHQPTEKLPPADVILHTTSLSGAGIAWYFSQFLDPEFAKQELDLAVLGTLADQVELVGPNRSLAVYGLLALRNTVRPSLLALARLAKIDQKKIDANSVQFSLTPRINAIGRLGDANQALKTLLSRERTVLYELSQTMESVNIQRQNLMKVALHNLEKHVLTQPEDNVVVALGDYAEGIVGLLAGKLVDQFHKPAIVIARKHLKASARSVPGVDVTAALRRLPPDLFEALGGHAMAGGFTLAPDQTERFVKEIVQEAKHFDATSTEKTLQTVGELDWKLLSLETLLLFEKFHPFGSGNEEPIFSLGEIRVIDFQPVGKTREHLRLRLRSAQPMSSKTLQVICFRYKERIENEDPKSIRFGYVRLHPSNFRPGTVDFELVAAA